MIDKQRILIREEEEPDDRNDQSKAMIREEEKKETFEDVVKREMDKLQPELHRILNRHIK